MRIVHLSDHPDDMLRKVRAGQRKSHDQAGLDHAARLASHQARLRKLQARRDDARRRRRWLSWLRAVTAAWAEQARSPRLRVIRTGPSDQEEILTAGIAGERRVEGDLGQALDGGWVLFRGYHNHSGEIDHLLVGPRGIFAMEGKHRNATVHIDGDRWRYDKYDRYGNLVERGDITDRGGRSPSMQVNEAADELQKFLRSRGQATQIQRIVILTHDRSRLGSHRNLTVSVTTSTGDVIGMIEDSPVTLDVARVTAIERLIEQDHYFHQSRAGQRPGSQRRATSK